MAFLTINGYTVPVLIGSPGETPKMIGQEGEAFDGTWLRSVRGYKREWGPFTTTPMSLSDAEAIEGLLLGKGHTFNFEDTTYWKYSSKGLYYSAVDETISQGTAPKFGTYNMTIASHLGDGAYITYNPGYTNKWTVMFWYDVSATPGKSHYIINDNGDKWKDGVAGAYTTSFLTYSSGTFRFGTYPLPGASSYERFDDIVIMPYRVSSDMAETFGVATTAFSLLERLNLAGDVVTDASPVSVVGINVSIDYTPAVLSGTWTDNAASVTFTLREA